ncbi:hypothetical protein L210DRAFT_246285 [Boletus edulis BED1]|uniref:Uncharacterized protein n=1 Tax=Boletus edulis BED1 TaxID=1328754 RepID=A0AAD4BRJ0_BOLED|nr:hypothetical protein L210DRAFT_246285 [Boletus edulis BED1]
MIFRREDQRKFLDHILSSYGIDNKEVEIPLPLLPAESLAGLDLPFLAIPCPVSGCTTWRRVGSDDKTSKYMFSHLRRDHNTGTLAQYRGRVDLVPRYILKPYYRSMASKDPKASATLVFHPDYQPVSQGATELAYPASSSTVRQVESASDPLHNAPISAEWLQTLGWGQWILHCGASPDTLKGLVDILSFSTICALKDQRRQRLELGILGIHQLLDGYLRDANDYIDSKHGDLRSHIHAGSKAHYNRLQRKSYFAYRRPLTSTVAMLLRILHLQVIKDSSLKSFGSLPNILLKRGEPSMRFLLSLYEKIMSREEVTTLDRRATLSDLHALLASLVQRSAVAMNQVDYPTDITLILISLLKGDLFHDANTITKYCAILAHGMTAILIHEARLRDQSVSFEPHQVSLFHPPLHHPICLSPTSETPHDREDNGDNDSVGVVGVNEEVEEGILENLEGDGDGVEENTSSADGSSISTLLEAFKSHYQAKVTNEGGNEREGIFQYIAKERDQYLRFGQPTPYGHIKYIWLIAGKHAREETKLFDFTFMDDGQGLVIRHNAGASPIRLYFSQLAYKAKSAIEESSQRIRACLPPNCVAGYEEFQWQCLTDDLLSDASVFEQPDNQPILRPLRQQLIDALFSKRSEAHPRGQLFPFVSHSDDFLIADAKTWLQTHDRILSAITAAFTLTCGIPPRDFQFQSLQVAHDKEKGHGRSLFIIQNTLALGNPKAKQRGKTFKECLWGVSQAQAPAFLYFLGVLKPVFSEIIRRTNIIHPLFDTYIFVPAIPANCAASTNATDNPVHVMEKNCSLNGSVINRFLQEHTQDLPIRLTCGILRDKLTAVYRQFFPWLATGKPQNAISPVDLQGQHQTATSLTHYGRILVVPRALKMPKELALEFLETSRVLQAMYGLTSGDESWNTMSNNFRHSPFFAGRLNEPAALLLSRLLVMHQYGLGGVDSDAKLRNQSIIERILTDAPYGAIPSSAAEGIIGDDVLLQVARLVAYGIQGPPALSYPPPGGHSATILAIAVKKIVHSLEEWQDGSFKPLDPGRSTGLSKFLDRVESEAYDHFARLKCSHTDVWIATCVAIHKGVLFYVEDASPPTLRYQDLPVRGVPWTGRLQVAAYSTDGPMD